MFKKHLSDLSFFSNEYGYTVKKDLLFSPARFFDQTFPLRTRLIKWLLGVNDALILSKNTPDINGIRALLETLREKGFVHHYGEGVIFCDYPKLNYASVQYIIDASTLSETQLSWGYSLPGEDKEVAFSKALGESLERQASYYHPQNTVAKFPKLKCGDTSFLFPYLPKFTKQQYANSTKIAKSATDLKKTFGISTPSLTGDKSKFLPFEVLYWGQLVHENQKLILHPTSNGSGGGSSRTQAILSGWYELIERDHLLLYWFSGIPPRIIKNDTIPENLRAYVTSCESRYKLQIYFLDLAHDINIITTTCVIIDPVLNLISMGAKSGVSGELVLKSALMEALAVLSAIRKRKLSLTEQALKEILAAKPFTKVINRTDRVNMYSSPYGIKLIKEKFLSGKPIDFATWIINIPLLVNQNEEINHLISEFKKMVNEKGPGYHAYIHTYESKWLSLLNYHAVRIFVPSLIKLHLNETVATPISDRLNEFALLHGKKIESENDINPLPHFFP